LDIIFAVGRCSRKISHWGLGARCVGWGDVVCWEPIWSGIDDCCRSKVGVAKCLKGNGCTPCLCVVARLGWPWPLCVGSGLVGL